MYGESMPHHLLQFMFWEPNIKKRMLFLHLNNYAKVHGKKLNRRREEKLSMGTPSLYVWIFLNYLSNNEDLIYFVLPIKLNVLMVVQGLVVIFGIKTLRRYRCVVG